jgi:hypothetical protein
MVVTATEFAVGPSPDVRLRVAVPAPVFTWLAQRPGTPAGHSSTGGHFMGHDHGHEHGHNHPHHHSDDASGPDIAPAFDLDVPDVALSPSELSRRGFFRRAGLLGAGVAAASVLAGPAQQAAAARTREWRRHKRSGYMWLTGDHHIHTQYSSDGKYRVVDQVQHAAANGLDWMVVTDHGSATHARVGVDLVHPDILNARDLYEQEILVFQGLEWNIPAAEHATVFVHPGSQELAVLKEFENGFDGAVRGWSGNSAANELHALEGLDFLAAAVGNGRVSHALMLANHPARQGIDSPHEIRGWRDRQPTIAVGMEGAPGHQAAGIPRPHGPGGGRGGYDNSRGANSFAAYPPESYVTYGGFDWMTATVGGLWDSLLAEGKPWWITANSDSHNNYLDTSVRGPGSSFNANGRYNDPVHGGPAFQIQADFWPGYYSRTHVGAAGYSYRSVMEGIRNGRVWVGHGGLVDGVDVRLRSGSDWVTLGETLFAPRGQNVELVMTITPADLPNWAQFVPQLNRVDVIRGSVTGPATDRDAFSAPDTRVVQSFDTSGYTDKFTIRSKLGRVEEPFYVRFRGTDGNRAQVGLGGMAVDPVGPAMDVLGSSDPWADLWFYANPMWVVPV